jgi:hypothetical protein
MVCYLLVKMINKMVNYFVNKKDHPITMDMLKSTCPKWQDEYFDTCPNGVFSHYIV